MDKKCVLCGSDQVPRNFTDGSYLDHMQIPIWKNKKLHRIVLRFPKEPFCSDCRTGYVISSLLSQLKTPEDYEKLRQYMTDATWSKINAVFKKGKSDA